MWSLATLRARAHTHRRTHAHKAAGAPQNVQPANVAHAADADAQAARGMSRLTRERNAADFYTSSETFAADVSVDGEQMNSNG
eukprot:CAMPEP_0179450830 /NCGR_PEP_ID=MMETSP0799-20121207/34808_1 /TAXON_ID=46947 /ORGANISM="Geminigera cryophila, Strain CCMP2564" /LENGTH=82 /DNA_ID=CAMNT_0021245329 /DNA_START=91 /DNA_END=336 /DNA_ORIENTATION=+